MPVQVLSQQEDIITVGADQYMLNISVAYMIGNELHSYIVRILVLGFVLFSQNPNLQHC
jgi:hypothetical protein